MEEMDRVTGQDDIKSGVTITHSSDKESPNLAVAIQKSAGPSMMIRNFAEGIKDQPTIRVEKNSARNQQHPNILRKSSRVTSNVISRVVSGVTSNV